MKIDQTRTLGDLYQAMVRIRVFEERVAELVEQGDIRTPTHLYIGQEAVAVGITAALTHGDLVWGNHRSHGHFLAKGGSMKALMAELFCKTTGCSRGRGGSMHLFDKEVGILGTVPMVAATIPIAVGAGLAAAYAGTSRISVAFFGDGATEEGVFHEAMNFAALHKLPVLFVCENNHYSSHLPLASRRAQGQLMRHADPYGVPAVRVDGNDVQEVYRVASEAVDKARSGGGPTFIEALTYRWRGHVGAKWDLDMGIRDRAEVQAWMAKCPIALAERTLVESGLITATEKARIEADARREIAASEVFALESPYPNAKDVLNHVFLQAQEAEV